MTIGRAPSSLRRWRPAPNAASNSRGFLRGRLGGGVTSAGLGVSAHIFTCTNYSQRRSAARRGRAHDDTLGNTLDGILLGEQRSVKLRPLAAVP